MIFSCSQLSEVVRFTCGWLAAGSWTAGVNRIVAVRGRLIGPVSRLIVRVVRAIRDVRAIAVIRAIRAIRTVRTGVVIYTIISVRPAGPARIAVVARRTSPWHSKYPTSVLVLVPLATYWAHRLQNNICEIVIHSLVYLSFSDSMILHD